MTQHSPQIWMTFGKKPDKKGHSISKDHPAQNGWGPVRKDGRYMPCFYVTVDSGMAVFPISSLGGSVGEAWKMNEEPGMGLWEDTKNTGGWWWVGGCANHTCLMLWSHLNPFKVES